METLLIDNWGSTTRTVESVAARRGLPRADWDDLLQDTLIHLIRHPPKAGPVKYLMGAVRKTAVQKIYEQRGLKIGHQANSLLVANNTYSVGLFRPYQDGEIGLMDERILPVMASAEDVFMASLPSKRQEALRGAIEKLPDKQRRAMTLRYYEELSVPAVATAMGITHSQASNLLEVAMRSLKAKLNPGSKNRSLDHDSASESNPRGKSD